MSQQPDSGATHKKRTLTTSSLVFFVVACVAPMAVISSIVPLALYLGNGSGFVGAIVIAALVLLCFAGGYVALGRHVINAGAFYAYVAKGLGKPAGVAASFVAMLSYNAAFWSLAGSLGFFTAQAFDDIGVHLPWQFWCAVAVGIVALLGRRAINASAKVLTAALCLEVLVLLVLDVAIIAKRGLAAFPMETLSPHAFTSGSVGVALLLAFNMYIGFEATAIFAEEAKDPQRSVPRATYIAVGIIAVFFGFGTMVLIGSAGPGHIQGAIDGDPGTFLFRTADKFVGAWLTDIMRVLNLGSLFAALLGIHNAASRYFFSLGRENLLPSRLGRLHPRWNSPSSASALQIIVSVVVLGVFGIANANPLLTIVTSATGLGTVGILFLQGAVALACVAYFRRNGHRNNLWATLVGPLISAVVFAVVVVLALQNYAVLSGTNSGIVNTLPWVIPALICCGIAYALWLRKHKPETYQGIGEGGPPATTNTETVITSAMPHLPPAAESGSSAVL